MLKFFTSNNLSCRWHSRTIAVYITCLIFCFVALTAPVLASGPVALNTNGFLDLGISNDSDYDRLIGAIRAAEYVRSDAIASEVAKPRVYATLATVMAYSEANPNASNNQLQAYLQAADSFFSNYLDGDPELVNPATFYAAVRFIDVQGSEFTGTNTRTGERALGLLGITVPDPDSFDALENRMIKFEISLTRSLNYRNEIFDLLVNGFFGVDPSGNERPTLPALLNSYFNSEGIDASLGSERLDLSDVNDALAFLPADYAGYLALVADYDNASNVALRDELNTQFTSVLAGITATVQSLEAEILNAPDLVDSITDPASVEQELQALRERLSETAKARAAASAATYLMLQSNNSDVGDYAFVARDYSQISLVSDESAATTKSLINIGTGLVLIGVASSLKEPDYGVAVEALAGVAAETLELTADLKAPPGVDEQTFDQVVQLRQQVEEMRMEMSVRFSRIDGQLNNLFLKVSEGFDAIGTQVNMVQDTVEGISREMTLARSQLRRLESALYTVVGESLEQLMKLEANAVLDRFESTNAELPYTGAEVNFLKASNNFFTYATDTATGTTFAGPKTTPDDLAENAADLLGGLPVSGFLNDLVALPTAIALGSLPALLSTQKPLAGIEPWSQSAAAYAQLGRENPWYMSLLYRTSLENFLSDPENKSPPELDSVIATGEQIVALVDAIRHTEEDGSSLLFDALIENYKSATAALQQEIDNEIFDFLPGKFKQSLPTLDYWMDSPQDIDNLQGALMLFDGGADEDLNVSPPVSRDGFQLFAPRGLSENGKNLFKIWYLIQQEKFGVNFKARANYGSISDEIKSTTFYLGLPDQTDAVSRSVDYQLEQFISIPQGGIWGPVTTDDTGVISERFKPVWEAGFQAPVLYEDVLNGFRAEQPDYTRLYDSGTGSRLRIEDEALGLQVSTEDVQGLLYPYRFFQQQNLLSTLDDENSLLAQKARELDDAIALINAYVSIGLPKELKGSSVLRSALRAVPGTSEVGLGSADVLSLVLNIRDTDTQTQGISARWADQEFNIKRVGNILDGRIEIIRGEIERGLQRPRYAPDYVGWVLAELRDLREDVDQLAKDDTYLHDGSVVTVDALNGLLANDATQGPSPIAVDTAFAPGDGYVAPSNGGVIVSADGSFQYTPNPGFSGTDSFTYRSQLDIDGVPDTVYSNVATVVITTEAEQSSVSLFSDGFESDSQ